MPESWRAPRRFLALIAFKTLTFIAPGAPTLDPNLHRSSVIVPIGVFSIPVSMFPFNFSNFSLISRFWFHFFIECVGLPVLLHVNDFDRRNQLKWAVLMLFGNKKMLAWFVCMYVFFGFDVICTYINAWPLSWWKVF